MGKMHTKTLMTWVGATVLAAMASTLHAEQITVETVDCTGAVGFNSFDERRLFKIQEGHCANPHNQKENLQQILLRSNSGITRYEVLWVTAGEASNVMDQIRGNRQIRQDYLRSRNRIEVNVSRQAPRQAPASRASAQEGDDAASTAAPAASGIELEVLDPPLSRSASHLITDSMAEERTVVGKVGAASGLLSLSVNGKQVEANEHGVFRSSIPVQTGKTQVQIVAIDNAGQRESRDFWIVNLDDETKQQSPQPAAFGKYYALLIGLNEYPNLPDLKTAVADITAIGDVLEQRYGFVTYRLINPQRYEILSEINRLRKELTEVDNLLVYYAGHGEYDRKNRRGHWLPVDAELDNPANWISTVDITDSLNRMSARHILVVADSCYSGSLTRSVQSELEPGLTDEGRQRWLKLIAKTPSRTVLTSGGLKPVLDGGGGQHSIFASALLAVLRDNQSAIDGTTIYRQIRERVAERAKAFNMDQIPEYAELKSAGHEFGDFVLIPDTSS